MDPQAVGAQAHAMGFGHPLGELGGGAGARACRECGAHGIEHGRRQRRLLAPARFGGQGIAAAVQEGFDPGTHGLLMLAEVAGNLRHTPARVGEAHHLQPIAGASGKPGLARALAQFLALCVSQGYPVHKQ